MFIDSFTATRFTHIASTLVQVSLSARFVYKQNMDDAGVSCDTAHDKSGGTSRAGLEPHSVVASRRIGWNPDSYNKFFGTVLFTLNEF